MVVLNNGWALRKRQEECHDKLIWAYNEGYKDFFIAAVCRFGKTITTIASLRDLGTQIDPNNQVILILSTMDIKAEWFDGAEKVGFDTSLIGESKDNLRDINTIDFSNLSESGKHIVYVSTQKLGNGSIVSEALIKWFNRHKGLKSIVYDECHLGSGTLRTAGGDTIEREYDGDGNIISEEQKHILGIIERLDYDNRVYLSGTPYRKYLQKEFQLDRASGDDISYKYTLTDEKLDYKNGIITDYTPIQLQMHILDYKNSMENLISDDDKDFTRFKSMSSAYFKKLFSEPEYNFRAIEFLNQILDFSNQHNIKNWIFFVPLKKVGADLVKHFSKMFADKIEFLNLSEDYQNEEQESADYDKNVNGLNELYKNQDGRLKIGITCNKCGTGSTMEDLDAVAFLKDTSQAISFIQKSQRPRTPKAGKSIGYVLCFNSFEGLEAYKNYVIAETQTNDDEADKERKFKDKYEEFKNNEVIDLYLDLKKIDNYEDLIDIENTYIPGKYPLFNDFEFDLFDLDDLKFFTSVKKLKNEFEKKLGRDLRDNEDFKNAQTPSELKAALRNAGYEDEANQVEQMQLTEDQKRQLLEYYYVSRLRTFYEHDRDRDYVLNPDQYEDIDWVITEAQFGSRRVWKYIIETYPRYVNMIYNFLEKGF